MNPNEVLNSLRVYSRNQYSMKSLSDETVREVLDNVLGKFSALDEWLSQGGAKPTDWES